MRAMIEMGNGTTITVDGTAEEISDCYVQMLQGIIELNEWYRDEHGDRYDEDEHGERGDGNHDGLDDEDEQAQAAPPPFVVTRDDTIDGLLDYISRTRGNQSNQNEGE